MSKNYKLKSGNYLKIDKTDEGYEYSLYEECKRLIDGGILENLDLSEDEALKEILKILVSVFTCFVLTFASLNFSIIHEIKKFNCYICSYS